MSIALMYHALYRDGDLSPVVEEDRPYAVSFDSFRRQLDRLQQGGSVGLPVVDSPRPDFIITFDDGHISNAELAAPELQQRGLQALFFITTGFTGKRDHFCGADELLAMDAAGMLLGTHGVSHRFLDDLSPQEQRQELLDSRAHLEDIVGKPCLSTSFPGGRYSTDTLNELPASGYRQWYGSAFDVIADTHWAGDDVSVGGETDDTAAAKQPLIAHGREPLPRIAIRQDTDASTFERMVTVDSAYYATMQRQAKRKQALRKVLGNKGYHAAYRLMARLKP